MQITSYTPTCGYSRGRHPEPPWQKNGRHRPSPTPHRSPAGPVIPYTPQYNSYDSKPLPRDNNTRHHTFV